MSASVRTNRLKTGNDIQAHYLLNHCHEIYMRNNFHFLEILGSHSPGKCHIFSLILSVFWTHLSCSYLVLIIAVGAGDILLSAHNLLFAEGCVSVVSSDQRLKIIRH